MQITCQKNLWKANYFSNKYLWKEKTNYANYFSNKYLLKAKTSYANYFSKTILLSVNKSQIYTFLPFYIYFQITQNNVLFTTQKNPYT